MKMADILAILFLPPILKPLYPVPMDPNEYHVHASRDPGENKRIPYLIDHFRLSPPLNPEAVIKLYVGGSHLRAIMYGYQINRALGNV